MACLAGVPDDVALRSYQATRDRLSTGLFVIADEIAAYDWGATTVEALLRRLSSAMSDEVDYLQKLPAGPASKLVDSTSSADTHRRGRTAVEPTGLEPESNWRDSSSIAGSARNRRR